MYLPDFIILDILSRLPIRTLLQSRCVCKTWFNLLLDPYFSSVRLATSPPFINIVFPSLNGFSLVELQDHVCNYTNQRHRPLWFRKLLPAMSSIFRLNFLGSCNGLLCFSDHYHNNVNILNPISGEYVALPKPKTEKERDFEGVAYGFGCSSATGHYKVVIVCKMVEVFSLASGVWRNLGDSPLAPLSFFPSESEVGVTLNGAIHWAVNRCQLIFSFNVEDEQFGSIPLPPGLESFARLGVLGNCLCVVATREHQIDLWSMKHYGVATSWSKDCILNTTILLEMGITCSPLQPITIWNDGEILMSSNVGTLVSYNPKRRNLTRLRVSGIGLGKIAVSFVSSFQSLKDVPLAECLRILNVNSN
ncbi:F-box protein At3g07870-like [Cornus florida]|uniref:F-box protein At3g07870-like n=1 Tax=Cornus florida TaxID=4283 RepID=UPI00289A20D3|nr:F-box protein At3g07870-like [Cornus florida]